MNEKVMNREDALRAQAEEETGQTEEALARLGREEADARRELEALEKQWPLALAAAFHDETRADERERIRARRDELRRFVDEDVPVLRDALARGRDRARSLHTEANALARKRATYDNAKARLAERYSIADVEELRLYARALGEEKDAEAFLRGLGKAASGHGLEARAQDSAH